MLKHKPVNKDVALTESVVEPEQRLLLILKVCMVVGICLLVIGHIILSVTFINDDIGHRGYMLGAALSALGVVLSLPTKLYVTVLLMEHENHTHKRHSAARRFGK